jgi:ABC-type branched-subunit amino acid transport system ATPase component
MEIADRAYVIEGGKIRYEGAIAQLEKQSDVKEKYLMI